MSGPGYVFRDSGVTPPAVERTEETYHNPSEIPENHAGIIDKDRTVANLNPELRNSKDSGSTFMKYDTTANKTISKLPASVTEPFQRVQDSTVDYTNSFTRGLDPDSHDLAHSYNIEGTVQIGGAHGKTNDVGWHNATKQIPDPLIDGIRNGDLFSLIRRFNKDVFSVKSVPLAHAKGLDLNEAWSNEYNSDKVTLNLQRFYIRVVLRLASFGKQVARLRSWKETGRTGGFLAAYIIAWLFDFLIPLALGTLIAIISSKTLRELLFPPTPLALVNATTGGLQKPQAGQLGTTNTLTGAPEKQEGEAVEEEAAKFVQNVRHLIQKTIGMHENDKNEGDPLEGKVPKPIRKAIHNIKGAGTSSGHTTQDKGNTELPMEEALWDKAKPEVLDQYVKRIPHGIGEIVDNWERFENAISPTPPFGNYSFLRIDGVLVPLFLASVFINSNMVYKAVGFLVGFIIFGDPVLTPSLQWLNTHYPHWMELLEPKNNLLRGVPTNSQLAITLLRIGEANNTPLPPIPTSNPEDPELDDYIDPEDIPLSATETEKRDAIEPSPIEKAHSHESGESKEDKHPRLSKFTKMFKGNTKAVVETKLTVDKVRATAGSDKAKGHLGILPKEKNIIYAGPSDFKARYDGKKGWLCIRPGVQPTLEFTHQEVEPHGEPEEKDIGFSINVKNIHKLKRATAFVKQAGEMAANFAEDKKLLASLEVEDVAGKTWRFTAVPERDELFNRLVALGGQRWENQ